MKKLYDKENETKRMIKMENCIEVNSLNNNEYIYNYKYNLITPKILYSEEMVEKIASQYFVMSSPISEKDFLENKDFDKPRCLGLVLTDGCNFRCKYCANSDEYKYSKGFLNKRMSSEVLEAAVKMYVEKYLKAIDLDPNLDFSVMFYGGEPLLEYELIKKAVDLIVNHYKIKKPIFTITTNGSLIDDEMISFFKKYNFDVNISMDGYKEIHDKNRVTADNRPTFELVLNNFYKLKTELGNKVGIITTFDTQVSPMKLYNFYYKNDSIAQSLRRVSSVNNVNTNYYSGIENYELYDKELNQIFSLIKQGEDNNFLTQLYNDKFLPLMKRKEFYDISFACCSPISAKLTVSTNGDLHICEKVNENYPIGNVYTGIDYKKAYKYYDNIIKIRSRKCSACQYHNICNPCYAQLNVGGDTFELSDSYCQWMKEATIRTLRLYCTFLDSDIWPEI